MNTAVKGFNPYGLKPWFTKRLATFIYAADRKNISPDVFTLVGIFGAFIGALVLALPAFSIQLPWWLSLVLVFIFGLVVRLGGANLDGAVARARGVSRPAGFILNELGDRISDYLLWFGLFLGAPEPWKPYIFLTALIASLPTLVSVSGAAVGATRFNGGPFGKTERSIFFVIVSVFIGSEFTTVSAIIFGSLLALVALGSILTTLKRFRLIGKALNENGTAWSDDQPTVVKGATNVPD